MLMRKCAASMIGSGTKKLDRKSRLLSGVGVTLRKDQHGAEDHGEGRQQRRGKAHGKLADIGDNRLCGELLHLRDEHHQNGDHQRQDVINHAV